MLNDSTLQYCKQLIETMRGDYPYYLLYTNTNVEYTSSYDLPTCYLLFSKKPITANNRYNYSVDSPVCYAIKNSNASYSFPTERVSVISHNSTVVIPQYEFVYTNAVFESYSIQPDITANNQVKNYEYQGFAMLIALILVSVIFYKLIKR